MSVTGNFKQGVNPPGTSAPGERNFQQSKFRNRVTGGISQTWDFLFFLNPGTYGFPGDPDYDPTLGYRTDIPEPPSRMDEISGNFKDYTLTTDQGGDSPVGRYFGPVNNGVAAATFRWINAVPMLGGFYNGEISFLGAQFFSGADGSSLKIQIVSYDGAQVADVVTFAGISTNNTFSFDSRALLGKPTAFFAALLISNFNGFPGSALNQSGGWLLECTGTRS